jgi:predicted DCC family thiol-disulfide oxidoreductase YuxK
VLRWDRRRTLEPVALQDGRAAALLADLDEEERMRSAHLVSPGGKRWSGGHAAPPLLRLLPGGRLPAALLGSTPELTERAYRWVAEHRGGFGRPVGARARARADAIIRGRQGPRGGV